MSELFPELAKLKGGKKQIRADRYRHMLEMMEEPEEPVEATSPVELSFAETHKLLNKRLNEFENDIYARLTKEPRDIGNKHTDINGIPSWLDRVDDRVICQLLRVDYKKMHDRYLDDYYKTIMATVKNKKTHFPAFKLWLI